MPRCKRKYTRSLDRRNQRATDLDVSASVDSQATAAVETSAPDIRHIVSTRGAKRKVAKSVLESNLRKTYKELDFAQSTLEGQDRTIASLKKKHNDLTNIIKSNREYVRESKNSTASAVKAVKSQLSETQLLHLPQ